MAEIPTAITPPSTIGLERYLDMLFSSISCTLSSEGSSISIPVWEISQEVKFLKNTLLDSLNHQPFSPPSTIGSDYNLDMLFVWMLYRFWMVEIITIYSKKKLCFLHSKSTSFRSVWLNLCVWKFHHWMELIFGYVILIVMNYNLTVWIDCNIIHLVFMVDWNCCQN
jgi:hypothetical protein